MKHYLIIENSNYADEFDLQGFVIKDAESEEALKKQILEGVLEDEGDFPIEKYFGTNEYTEISDENELWSMLSIYEINEKEYKILLKLLGPHFGITSLL